MSNNAYKKKTCIFKVITNMTNSWIILVFLSKNKLNYIITLISIQRNINPFVRILYLQKKCYGNSNYKSKI